MSQSKNPRLQFTDAERGDPRLKEHIRRADKAADRADAAQKKVPKRKKPVKRRTVDPDTGKVRTHLRFEEVDKPAPVSKLTHAAQAAPVHAAAGAVHRKISEAEQDNVGVESARVVASSISFAFPLAGKLTHSAAPPFPTKPCGFAGTLDEQSAEGSARLAAYSYRSQKLRPYREAAKAKMKLEKANVNAIYQKCLQDNPTFTSNPVSRWQQKRAIKKQYAASVRAGESVTATMENSIKAAKRAAKQSEQVNQFVWRHKKGFLLVIALFLIVSLFLNGMSSCSMMVEGVLSVLGGSTHPSSDEAMLGAEAEYAGMEQELQSYIVIDYDAPVNEDEEQYKTYFLNKVDEADLAALVEQGEPAACSCTDKCHAGAVNTSCPLCAVNMSECVGKEPEPEKPVDPAEPDTDPEPEKKDGINGMLAVVLAVALAGGGAAYFLKFKKKKPDTRGNADLEDYDYGDEDEDEYEGDGMDGEGDE